MSHYVSIERNQDLNYVDLIREAIEQMYPTPEEETPDENKIIPLQNNESNKHLVYQDKYPVDHNSRNFNNLIPNKKHKRFNTREKNENSTSYNSSN